MRTLDDFISDPESQAAVAQYLAAAVCPGLPKDWRPMCEQARGWPFTWVGPGWPCVAAGWRVGGWGMQGGPLRAGGLRVLPLPCRSQRPSPLCLALPLRAL